jgi:hypothetical protein
MRSYAHTGADASSRSNVKQLIRAAAKKVGYRVQSTRCSPRQLLDAANLRDLEIHDLLCRRMFEVGKALTFLQVGAFDGLTADPLRRYIGN